MSWRTDEGTGGSSITSFGSIQSTNFTASTGELNRVNCAAASVGITLPAAATLTGRTISIQVTDMAVAYEAVVSDGGSFTEYLQAIGHVSDFVSDGTDWHWLKKGQAYVSRGDVAAWDYEAGDLTRDNAYHDLDISSKIPVASYENCIRFSLRTNHSSFVGLTIRKNGNSNVFSRGFSGATSSATTISQNDVECDSAGVIEYAVSSAAGTQGIAILGWWVNV